MNAQEEPVSGTSRFRRWAHAITIWIFLCVWISMFTAGLAAGACRNERYEGERKVRACTISLTMGAWVDLFPLERARRSIILLERGIASVEIGRTDAARADVTQALGQTQAHRGPHWAHLLDRMRAEPNSDARALFLDVVETLLDD